MKDLDKHYIAILKSGRTVNVKPELCARCPFLKFVSNEVLQVQEYLTGKQSVRKCNQLEPGWFCELEQVRKRYEVASPVFTVKCEETDADNG